MDELKPPKNFRETVEVCGNCASLQMVQMRTASPPYTFYYCERDQKRNSDKHKGFPLGCTCDLWKRRKE